MTPSLCGAEAVLRPGGPVQIPTQPCCIAVLLRGTGLRCPFLWAPEQRVLVASETGSPR
ncbi:hypothetical protein [Actinoplanes sp. NPDC051494]|uniref:hypothetical protein n=1 Tax=Actinoplanes sp. NPDC051494 TaxID=3363907 RepID=UPI0037B2012D